jgi:hypothetical protein
MSDIPDCSRRRYLAALPVAVGVAGCAGELGSGNGGGNESGSGGTETPKLLGIGLQNISFMQRTATLEVEKEGSVVHSKEYTLEPGIDPEDANEDGTGNIAFGPGGKGSVVLDEPWMGDRVQYAVTATVLEVGKRVYTTEDYVSGRDDIKCRGFDIDFTITGSNLTASSTPMPPDCQSTDVLP